MHNRDKRYGKPEMRRNIETHKFIHPQALPHSPTTSPRDFAGHTRFYILKFNIETKSQRQKSKELHL